LSTSPENNEVTELVRLTCLQKINVILHITPERKNRRNIENVWDLRDATLHLSTHAFSFALKREKAPQKVPQVSIT